MIYINLLGTKYQYRSLKISRNFLIERLKEKFFGCGLDKKAAGELLMQHDVKLEARPFRGPFFIDEELAI